MGCGSQLPVKQVLSFSFIYNSNVDSTSLRLHSIFLSLNPGCRLEPPSVLCERLGSSGHCCLLALAMLLCESNGWQELFVPGMIYLIAVQEGYISALEPGTPQATSHMLFIAVSVNFQSQP